MSNTVLGLRECRFCKIAPDKLKFCYGERKYSDTEWEDVFAVCCTNPTCEAHGRFMVTKELALESWNDV